MSSETVQITKHEYETLRNDLEACRNELEARRQREVDDLRDRLDKASEEAVFYRNESHRISEQAKLVASEYQKEINNLRGKLTAVEAAAANLRRGVKDGSGR